MIDDLKLEAEEVERLENLLIPMNKETEKAINNIVEILGQLNISENLLKEIKANIYEIRKSNYIAGIFKGLEFENWLTF